MTREKSTLDYPDSPRDDIVDMLHGKRVADPYRWLEDIDSGKTRDWIAAQNQLTFDYLSRIPSRQKIRQRIGELWNYERYSVPIRRSGRYFLERNDGLQNQSVLYWMDSLSSEPRVLLDPNVLAADGTVALAGYEVSEDGCLLAYGLSAAGSDWQEWRVRDVGTGRDLPDRLQWIKFSGASWTHDGRGFFYSRYDEPAEGMALKGANYYQKLHFHQIGTPQSADELIYERPDHKEWRFGGNVTRDGRYLIIHVSKGTRRENGVFYSDLHHTNGVTVELLNRFDAAYTFVGNDATLLYFLTDLDAPMLRVVGIDVTNPDRSNWYEIIPESSDVLQSVHLVAGRFVASYLHDAHSQVKVFEKDGHLVRDVELPGMGTVEGFDSRAEEPETFFLFTNFVTPGTVYRYDVESGQAGVFRKPEMAFDSDEYVTKQVFYQSEDGTRVPMFVSHKRGLTLDGNNPVYLYGYGGFNISRTPAFSVAHLAWMEMGGVFAQANLRGGGEYGKPWHEAGTKLKKQNVFDDFIAAAEWLIANRYTRSSRLAIGGRSNGGLLIGACMTQRPDLFGACLPMVGVLDMLRFHRFTIGWAWTSDYGSPDNPEEFEALHAYSPYHNIKPGSAYPPTLIATGDHDDRVFPAHSFKFAAALQAGQEGDAPALIRIETRAGHGLGKPTTKLIEEAADLWAFLVDALAMDGINKA